MGVRIDAGQACEQAGIPPGALPAGATFDAATLTLTLPAIAENAAATTQRYTVIVVAQVTKDTGNVAGVTRTNTARFTSTAPPTGTTPADVTANANVTIVEPAPALAKTPDPTQVTGGQVVTYTLRASNPSGSVLHAGWVVDCVPTGLTFASYGAPSQGSTVAAVDGDGTLCPAGTAQLGWNVGDIAPGGAPTLSYTAVVDPAATGQQKYVNTATLTGNSLAGPRATPADPGNPDGRTYAKTATGTVTVAGANIAKVATPNKATIGQTVAYRVVATAPANVTFYRATLIDTLPTGIDASSVAVGTVTCAYPDGSRPVNRASGERNDRATASTRRGLCRAGPRCSCPSCLEVERPDGAVARGNGRCTGRRRVLAG